MPVGAGEDVANDGGKESGGADDLRTVRLQLPTSDVGPEVVAGDVDADVLRYLGLRLHR